MLVHFIIVLCFKIRDVANVFSDILSVNKSAIDRLVDIRVSFWCLSPMRSQSFSHQYGGISTEVQCPS